ncbi:hypothetical protein RJT34_04519 [Clitoria ternatea]|uniref:ARM repeat superfamily protein n=1 Tax=Clitoria ternatea TaxID=43366 RepID=A0AAN9KPV9_CLITE
MEKHRSEKEECVMVLQRCVKKLHFGSWGEKEVAAKVIERLAEQDGKVRGLIIELGVVPVLVSMAVSDMDSRRRLGLKALIHIANGNYWNKALIVEAGILSKLPKKIVIEDESTSDYADLLASLSSIANTQFPQASLHLIQFLIDILKTCSSFDTKQSCLVALSNISAVLQNAGPLISNGVVPILLELSLMREVSEKALTTLGNLVVTLIGKKAIENSSMVPQCMIETLSWEDKPKCQELSAYILMILAHHSSSQRNKMVQARIVPTLLEVALLGSPLVQKRAMRILQWFKDESRQIKLGPHSGPQTPTTAKRSLENQGDTKEGKRLIKNLVKESLRRNLEIITKRANVAVDSSKLKSLFISTSSKSLLAKI